MPATYIDRVMTGRCRECRRNRQCFVVLKLQGGGYNRAPHHGSAMLCVECTLDFAPAAASNRNGYIGAGRWDRTSVLSSARDAYVPTTESEAATEARIAAAFIRA